MLVTCEQIEAAEQRLFSAGTDPEPLMDKAGLGCARAIRQFFPRPAHAVLFVGKGNNGGDALVTGRHLRRWGWKVSVRLVSDRAEDVSPLNGKKLTEFENEPESPEAADLSHAPPRVLVDGLLGIGARGPVRGRIGGLSRELNELRSRTHAVSFAVDIPSGVDGNSGEPYDGAVIADFTLSITRVKAGVAADAAIDHVGRIVQIALPEIEIDPADAISEISVLNPADLLEKFLPRSFDTHKGQAGRVAIVAGSPGFTGAAKLCSLGALHGGAGLVTLFAEASIHEILAASAPPEVMVKPTADYRDIADFQADAIAIGPGIGQKPNAAKTFLHLMENDPRPVVIDADALNLLSDQPDPVKSYKPKAPRLLTPHPGELARFRADGLLPDQSRADLAREFVDHCPVTLLFKGARTVIGEKNQPLSLNATGHPGMATGGIGDVLTGLCAALIAQGLKPYDAAAAGSWLIGRSAEIAIFEDGESAESLSAGMIAANLGRAFSSLKRGDF